MNIDHGRQAERTTLAWQRTALGLAGVSALLVHDARGDLVASAPGVAGLVVAIALLVYADTHHRRHDAEAPEHATMGIAAVRLMASLTVLLALAAVLVVIRPSG